MVRVDISCGRKLPVGVILSPPAWLGWVKANVVSQWQRSRCFQLMCQCLSVESRSECVIWSGSTSFILCYVFLITLYLFLFVCSILCEGSVHLTDLQFPIGFASVTLSGTACWTHRHVTKLTWLPPAATLLFLGRHEHATLSPGVACSTDEAGRLLLCTANPSLVNREMKFSNGI